MTSEQKFDFLDKRNLLFPPPMDESASQAKEPRPDPKLEIEDVTESPTPQCDPPTSEKRKEPITVEEEEEDCEETEEEDNSNYQLIRRRLGTRSTFTL